ncbi:MAG: 2-oxoglutarate dehydrogenase complex dihydrolipoyllysine-residue succinyltransferase [Bdellovibrionaceae bacterium]|nr:2-oxoglutarate dehydrogenase complex dihydrolipoyllysine-residue succinyltransferase [Pseudobdellovibrionaceae bacterium]
MDIKVPQAGESITEAILSEWTKTDNSFVEKDEIILILETDKASMEVVAEKSGLLTHKHQVGDTVKVGEVLANLDTQAKNPNPKVSTTSNNQSVSSSSNSSESSVEEKKESSASTATSTNPSNGHSPVHSRVGKLESLQQLQNTNPVASNTSSPSASTPPKKNIKVELPKVAFTEDLLETLVPMSLVRQTIAKRLLESQNQTATLSTFNEIDMSAIMNLRKTFKTAFEKKHGVRLGFMGFFIKACIEALKRYPSVNGSIKDNHIIHRNFVNMGVAVSSDKGLLVPVIKQAHKLSIAEIEQSIIYYAEKARNSRLSLNDLSNGTFTISNGGVFGSLLSTPILNPPQSGILGLHKIEERPIALNGEVVIRPMMYVTLSYDHCIIDGKESVGFLKTIKECMEEPSRLLLEV